MVVTYESPYPLHLTIRYNTMVTQQGYEAPMKGGMCCRYRVVPTLIEINTYLSRRPLATRLEDPPSWGKEEMAGWMPLDILLITCYMDRGWQDIRFDYSNENSCI